MKYTTKGPMNNRLAEIRQKVGLSPEQVTSLLGEKSVAKLTDYEQGIKTPNLKIALKLAAIYKLPIRVMLDGYFEACRAEIKREEAAVSLNSLHVRLSNLKAAGPDFCSFRNSLDRARVSPRDVSKARRHVAELISITAEKLGHI